MDFAVIKAWGLRSRIIQIRLASHQPAFELLIAPHGIEDYIYHIGISKQVLFFFFFSNFSDFAFGSIGHPKSDS